MDLKDFKKQYEENEEVSFDYNDTNFINIKRLYDFVADHSKDGFTFEEVIKEVIERAVEDRGGYELGAHETKSGHAEHIGFTYTFEYDEENDVVENEKITF